MLDTIYYKSKKEAILIFTNRSSLTVWSSDNNVIELVDELLAPMGGYCITLSEWKRAVESGKEDTQVIDLGKVA